MGTEKEIKRREIRVVDPSPELMDALEKRAADELRSINSLVKLILTKEFKIKTKPKSK
jgi:hypothetical protein